MSILKVDTINEKTSGNGVAIPGHVIQFVNYSGTTQAILSGNNTLKSAVSSGSFSGHL